jgi:uncharacterized membrane protein
VVRLRAPGFPHPAGPCRRHAARWLPPPGERLADTISDQIGSWRFLVIQTVVITLWVAVNAAGLLLHRSYQRDRTMAEHDYATNEHAEQLTEALLSELLRNSQATLAIADFHGIELEALVAHESQLAAKVDAVQEQLAEVEDVLLPTPTISRYVASESKTGSPAAANAAAQAALSASTSS